VVEVAGNIDRNQTPVARFWPLLAREALEEATERSDETAVAFSKPYI